MIIRKQPVISWLLNSQYQFNPTQLGVPMLSNVAHYGYLINGFNNLAEVRKDEPNWGLPELLMPSFEAVMQKSAKSFYNIDHQLFLDFYNDEVCGILLSRDCGTIIYGFAENRLYVWLFRTEEGVSKLFNYFYVDSTEENRRRIFCNPTLTRDEQLYNQSAEPHDLYELITNKLMVYLAVKKYVKVETIVVPFKSMQIVEDTIEGKKYKEKIKNESGQEVIVMDSRWFTRIINDNDIFVRGFFRFQNKKNQKGEWYKELIYVDSFVRHGYHRNALKDDYEGNEPLSTT